MKRIFQLVLAMGVLFGQAYDYQKLSKIIENDDQVAKDLAHLCDFIGGRPTGSEANLASVDWTYGKFQEYGVSVSKQAFEMPGFWLEQSSKAKITGDLNFTPRVTALTFSTRSNMYKTYPLLDGGRGEKEDFSRLGTRSEGAVIFIETDELVNIDGLFKEYSDAAKIEALAYKAGVAGVVYMSSRPKKLMYRHNASRAYDNTLPMLVMAREDGKRCLRALRSNDTSQLFIQMDIKVKNRGDQTSYNVISEIRGSEKPDEVVVIGSHLDSWGMGTGANDNGCNVVMMMTIAKHFVQLGITPKRTIRLVLWNGEEQGFYGSMAYTKQYENTMDDHVMALSVDIGSGAINGFFTGGRPDVLQATDQIVNWFKDLGPFINIDVPLVGTDNFDFMMVGVPNLVANHEEYNYALNYHAESDTYDKVDIVQLKKNTVIVAALTLEYANDLSIKLKRQTRSEIETLIVNTDLEDQMRAMMNVWDEWTTGIRGRQ
ncbi:MAG TPA: M20/M25/M40 family metallo-hydrolase [Candidatus Marinimicrobia bacterium]|jgi:Iap family predicted aminopeptidase|nr:M20/M25/M40 family metallo-hydrolase [Candidatus Neomarinimicrobiota bacterium]